MNLTLCVLLVYNDNGSVQTLCITRVSALCTKCLHRPIVIINQQYTKGEIHFIYLHCFHVFGFCFINRYRGNCCVSLENPTCAVLYNFFIVLYFSFCEFCISFCKIRTFAVLVFRERKFFVEESRRWLGRLFCHFYYQ